MKIAQRNDWKITPMPAQIATISVDRVYSQAEFDKIAIGNIPQEMEDKWFIFYEAPWLYLHRSWTGFCIFQIRFEPVAAGMKIVEVQVNRELDRHIEVEDRQDARLVLILINSLINRFDSSHQIEQQSQMLEYIKNRSIAPD